MGRAEKVIRERLRAEARAKKKAEWEAFEALLELERQERREKKRSQSEEQRALEDRWSILAKAFQTLIDAFLSRRDVDGFRGGQLAYIWADQRFLRVLWWRKKRSFKKVAYWEFKEATFVVTSTRNIAVFVVKPNQRIDKARLEYISGDYDEVVLAYTAFRTFVSNELDFLIWPVEYRIKDEILRSDLGLEPLQPVRKKLDRSKV